MFPVTRRRFTAYVIFQGAEHRRAWRIFTRRGWRHCLIVLPVYYPEHSLAAQRFSQVINPLTWIVQADVIFRSPEDLAQEALREGATCVIRFPVDVRIERDYVPRGLLTCVSMLKAILGVSAWYVWTPEHLARFLLRSGGKMVERVEPHGRTIRKQAEAGRCNAEIATPAGSGAVDARERRA